MTKPIGLRGPGLFVLLATAGGLWALGALGAVAPRGAGAQGPLQEAYGLVATWDGRLGQGAPGSLLDPAGVAVTADAVYIVDRGNDRIQRFTPSGGFVASWGQRGEDLADLRAPQDIAVAGNLLYVADRGNNRIVVYRGDGTPEAAWALPGLQQPWGIAAAGDRVYVTYPERGLVVVVRQGTEVARWSSAQEPRGVAVGPDGRVYVADYRASRVRILNPDGTASGELPTSLAPLDVSVDRAGDVYMLHELPERAAEGVILWYPAGSASSRLAMYRAGLRGLAVSELHGIYGTVASDARQFHGIVRYPWHPSEGKPSAEWSLLGYPPGRLNGPRAIHYGTDGRLWILDGWPRVQAFATNGDAVIQHLLPAQRVNEALPRQAVDVARRTNGDVIAGEPRYLHRLGSTGELSGTLRLADGGDQHWLTALSPSADDRRVLVLDSAFSFVREYGVTSTLTPLGGWPLGVAPPATGWDLYWDIVVPPAGSAATVFAVNRTAHRIEAYRDGRPSGSWAVEGTPARAAWGPGDRLFVLGTDGIVRKYTADGRLIAAWDAASYSAGASAVTDLAVDRDGRVYTVDQAADTVRVWAVDPALTPEPPSSAGGACRLRGDKRAEPQSVRIGGQVRVDLEVGGDCPNAAPQADILLAIDRSYSMNEDNKITDTIGAALTFVDAVDLSRDRVGVVTFNNTGQLAQGLTDDREAVRRALRAMVAVGGTNIADAIRVSTQELYGPRGRGSSLPVLILLTDGKDREPEDALEAAFAAQSRGMRIFTIGFGDVDPMTLVLAASSPEHNYYAPDASTLGQIYSEIARRILATVLARSMTVTDVVPGNMRYVEGSARPAAGWDAATRTLSWALTDVPFSGLRLSYSVEPRELGRHPTNVEASAEFTDGLDHAGRLRFPVPSVEVLSEAPTPTPTRTPYPTPTPTSRPPEPLFLPIALAQKCEDLQVHADVILVIDTSSSMDLASTEGGQSKIEAAKSAARQFVGTMSLPSDLCGIVSFNRGAQVEHELTGDRQSLLDRIGALRTATGTRIDLGLAAAIDELTGPRARAGQNHVIVLLTDGRSTGVSDPNALVMAEVGRARAANILIFAIGLGTAPEVDFDLLRQVATRPEYFYEAPGSDDLDRIYRTIAFTIRCYNLDWP